MSKKNIYAICCVILATIFSREELHYDEFILEGEVEISDDDSECNEKQCFNMI